jgi:hypothetical protein
MQIAMDLPKLNDSDFIIVLISLDITAIWYERSTNERQESITIHGVVVVK